MNFRAIHGLYFQSEFVMFARFCHPHRMIDGEIIVAQAKQFQAQCSDQLQDERNLPLDLVMVGKKTSRSSKNGAC